MADDAAEKGGISSDGERGRRRNGSKAARSSRAGNGSEDSQGESDAAAEGDSEVAADASGDRLDLIALKAKKIGELAHIAVDFNVEGFSNMRKQELIFAILAAQTEQSGLIYGGGGARDPAGRLRIPARARLQLSARARRHLRLAQPDSPLSTCAPATSSSGQIRPPKDGERYFALLKVEAINFEEPERAARQDPLRQPHAALSRTSSCGSSTTRRRTRPASSTCSRRSARGHAA